MWDKQVNLRREKSENNSGTLIHENAIPLLRKVNYCVKDDFPLDGDAPKQFIRAYILEENTTVRKATPRTWPFYLAKTAEKWYPHESVIEYMMNRIGEELGITMNKINLVRANGQIRFLSQYFIKRDEVLIHGAEICGQHLDDMEFAHQIANNPKTARELFTFEFICEAIRSVFPRACEQILIKFVDMLIFDAITGNNDRHFYNWGIIDYKKKITQKLPRFAPVFDSARGLYWNWSDSKIRNQTLTINGKRIVEYIENARPRVSINGNCDANHFELIRHLKYAKNEYKKLIDELSSIDNENKILIMLQKKNFTHSLSKSDKI